ncbi:TPA: hypothetical protein QDZ23_006173 [Pseudomonas putida]|nr:hypothetical protein [Pseudomonas putida]HDS0931376.1 hypothetical protein [Pseudomonas putida]
MADKLYKCSRCDGAGKIWLFTAVLGGVCFQCGGSGKQKTKPKPRAVKWAVFGHSRETGKIGRLLKRSTRPVTPTIAQVVLGVTSGACNRLLLKPGPSCKRPERWKPQASADPPPPPGTTKERTMKPRFYVSTSKSIIKALINMHSFEIQLSPIG